MLINSFIKYIRYELNLSAYTVLSYSNDLRQFKAFLANDKKAEFDVESASTSDVRAWLAQLYYEKNTARTIKRKLQALRTFYKYLLKRKIVEVNPTEDVEVAKVPKRLPDCMRLSNVDDLFGNECAEQTDFGACRDNLILLMIYTTGIRRSELIGLRDADVSANELKVHGKRNKDRIIPFGEELKEVIKKYRCLRDEKVGKTEAFFVRDTGEPLYPTLVYRLVNSRLREVGGGDRFSPHVLRHTFASAMLNAGAQLNSVKELLGHESLAATQVYTHVTYRELKSNYEHAHPRAIKKGG